MQSLPVLTAFPFERRWTPLPLPWPASHFDNIAINLTNYCPVECSFCFMKADPVRRRRVVLTSKALDRALHYAKGKKMRQIDVSGGEAVSEMELALKVVREAEVESISITTSGYFAVSDAKTRRVLDAIADALATRRASGMGAVEVRIHVSVDEFHSSVSMDSIERIIRAFEHMEPIEHGDMVLELRGILMDSDPVPKLIHELGGTIEVNNFSHRHYPTRQIVLPSGYRFTIHYGELKLLDEMLGTELAARQFDKVYENRLKVEPVYIGRGKTGGVSLDISYDGAWTIQEYLAKDFVLANANDADCTEKVDRRLSFDPLVVALRELGLNTVLDIVTRLRPDIRERSIAANNMYLPVSEILKNDELRDYVYRELIRAMQPLQAAATSSTCMQVRDL